MYAFFIMKNSHVHSYNNNFEYLLHAAVYIIQLLGKQGQFVLLTLDPNDSRIQKNIIEIFHTF